MNNLKITRGRKVFLDGTEIPNCLGLRINLDAGSDPEVELRVAVESIDIEGYTDFWRDLRRMGSET